MTDEPGIAKESTYGSFVAPLWLTTGPFLGRWDAEIVREIHQSLGIVDSPVTMNAEQRAAQRAEWEAKQAARQQATLAEHDALIADAPPLLVPILNLHAPRYYTSSSSDAICTGCDFAGYEGESPDYPCRTYELVKQVIEQTP
jgi:hypothetical protein